jgi:hypothetical protein
MKHTRLGIKVALDAPILSLVMAKFRLPGAGHGTPGGSTQHERDMERLNGGCVCHLAGRTGNGIVASRADDSGGQKPGQQAQTQP